MNGLSVPDLYLRFVGNTLFVFNPRGSKNIEEVGERRVRARAHGLIATYQTRTSKHVHAAKTGVTRPVIDNTIAIN